MGERKGSSGNQRDAETQSGREDREAFRGSRARVIYNFLQQFLYAARNGQNLPRLTLVFFAQLVHHFLILPLYSSPDITRRTHWGKASLAITTVTAILILAGYGLLFALYRHSVQTIFNRKLPPSILECLPSFGAHLALLKPLEVIFRYCTARFRVLPDIIVLGEVRCGTTTLCQYLSSLEGCAGPFCLWKHPELDKKESFYFVGHYLGRVDPSLYRMCFPLSIVKWFKQEIMGQAFFTYDGCAQYLTNPAVPYLIAQAYRDAGQPPPVLVACVRHPVHQTISWWKYENNAMKWGASMGLQEWNTTLRSSHYPPVSLSKALDFSLSEEVGKLYERAEELFSSPVNLAVQGFRLPAWAMTWPAGQLAGIGRNGAFATNIRRYEKVFLDAFPHHGTSVSTRIPASSHLQYVNVVPLEFLGDGSKVVSVLMSIMRQIDRRRSERSPKLLDSISDFHVCNGIHRNASLNLLSNPSLNPTKADVERLVALFANDIAELERQCNTTFDWIDSPL